jgi:hypothetical protein
MCACHALHALSIDPAGPLCEWNRDAILKTCMMCTILDSWSLVLCSFIRMTDLPGALVSSKTKLQACVLCAHRLRRVIHCAVASVQVSKQVSLGTGWSRKRPVVTEDAAGLRHALYK